MDRLKIFVLLAPVPALLGSLLLMHAAEVARSIWALQLGCAFIAFFLAGFAIGKNPMPLSRRTAHWLLILAVALLFLSVLQGDWESHRRWLVFAGARFYIAAFVLPSLLFLLAWLRRTSPSFKQWIYCAYIAIAILLTLQPDASQLTAFSLAAAVTLLTGKYGGIHSIITLPLLFVCTIWAWYQPDLLRPVSHVEGVIDLAWGINPFAAIAAVLAVATPFVGLFYFGFESRHSGLVTAAVYYLTICLLAGFTQLTPMPLLGFGAAPILGYYLLVYLIGRIGTETRVHKSP